MAPPARAGAFVPKCIGAGFAAAAQLSGPTPLSSIIRTLFAPAKDLVLRHVLRAYVIAPVSRAISTPLGTFFVVHALLLSVRVRNGKLLAAAPGGRYSERA